MPILDVVTRWSSTHQMLRKFALLVVDLSKMLYVCLDRALAYRDIVDSFVAKHRELRNLELDTSEWAIIGLVSDWLWMFRSATEQMSSSRETTLSHVHTIFHRLQDHLRTILRSLPPNSPPNLQAGLIRAHVKLADYHAHFDESPFYLWACRESIFLHSSLQIMLKLVLFSTRSTHQLWRCQS